MSDTELKEAELLLEAYGWCPDENRAGEVIALVKNIIDPFLVKRDPRAIWLKATMPNMGEEECISDEEFDEKWLELIKESSEGNCAEAQYSYGCHLYELDKCDEAVELYKQAAYQGYAPAQWCFGLDTLNGIGVPKDEKIGLHYIRLSAEQQYEYAIEFMIRNCKEGKFGFKKDKTEIKKWEIILSQSQ